MSGGVVAGGEPPHPLLGGAVRPLLGVDVAAALLLDPVVADRLGGVERLGDVALVDRLEDLDALGVGGAGRAAGPHAGVAVGLELEPDRVAGRTLLGADLAHGAEQVLDVVAELVGEDVRLHEVTTLATELPLEDVLEERRVEVDGLVGRAVERPDVSAGVAAAGGHATGERLDLRGLELLAGLLGEHLGPVALQRQLDRLARAVRALVGVRTAEALLVAVRRLLRAAGAGPGAACRRRAAR